MFFSGFRQLFIPLFVVVHASKKDIPCEWKSLTGAHYDLKALTLKETEKPYSILDGDIPCTPEEEPSFSYEWNFCSNIGAEYIPDVCKSKGITSAVALQYMTYATYSDCYVIGKYDPSNDDLSYKLIDEKDPTVGVSMTYALGEKCQSVGRLRSATIDLMCSNVESAIVSAQEPEKCQYHMVMKSYHGCPTECPITKNGLCNSHGHCAYDSVNKKSYCYCNAGYSGSSCTSSGSDDESYNGFAVQLALLITLLIITVVLVGVIGYMIYKITDLRKQQADDYSLLSSGAEMTHRHETF
mmetsp:Transcript_6215/g.9371  ORF Transcript_6215/g.9371 Transcript_6215/m.9371 type:complete len:297 (-) Transcript_6215:143-1033(-)